jgi:hypothetical protein
MENTSVAQEVAKLASKPPAVLIGVPPRVLKVATVSVDGPVMTKVSKSSRILKNKIKMFSYSFKK